MNHDQNTHPDDEVDANGYSRPSKSQRKRDSHELQSMGQTLVTMPKSRVDAIEMPELLREALDAYRRTKSHEGRRRQMQYIGKLMRSADPQPIKDAIAAFELGHARNALALHDAERWRAELIASDDALTRWIGDFPGTDIQALRALIRNARKDAAAEPEKRSGRGFRELFQFVKQHIEGPEEDDHEGVEDGDEDEV